MTDKVRLLDMNSAQIKELMMQFGEKPFKGTQVFRWLYRNISDFDQMSDISKDTRTILKEKCSITRFKIIEKQISKNDNTIKYAFETEDTNIIESVLMRYSFGNSVCISTQIGCKMGCVFCASKKEGYVRNLSPGEMSAQILGIMKDTGEKINNIVLMGIGEPLDNYDNVLSFIRNMNDKEGLNIGYRHITVSTCGLVEKIIKLSEEGLPINLSVSLHVPDDKRRKLLMPAAKTNSIDKIIEACNIYTGTTKRRITFEYALIGGFNDSGEDALLLASLLKGMLAHVNLIPLNKVEGIDYLPSERRQIEYFKSRLEKQNIPVSIRRELGTDIDAACGQLRRRVGGR